MALAGWEFLSSLRINRVMQALQDVRELPSDLVWLNRTPIVPATEGEITARYVNRILVADLIANDAEAVTYQTGKLSLESLSVPNIKFGRHLTQSQIAELRKLAGNAAMAANFDAFGMTEDSIVTALLQGIRQRMEILCIAMRLDSYTYNRFGININNMSWGMPSDLHFNESVYWTDATNATPITSILNILDFAEQRYGIMYNRLSMSITAFRYMTLTADFLNRAKAFILQFSTGPAGPLPQQNTGQMRQLAENMLGPGITIELLDNRYWQQAADGTVASSRYWPINKVLFSNSSDDNSPGVWDFANVEVEESVVAGAPGVNVGGFGGPQAGPVAYATVKPDLNPPNVTYWAVAKGFPRKHVLQATAVLNVGQFTDTIAVGEPF